METNSGYIFGVCFQMPRRLLRSISSRLAENKALHLSEQEAYPFARARRFQPQRLLTVNKRLKPEQRWQHLSVCNASRLLPCTPSSRTSLLFDQQQCP